MNTNTFEIITPARIISGAGSLAQMSSIAPQLGRRALVLTGASPQRADRLVSVLTEVGVETVVFSVAGEPLVDTVRPGVALAREKDCKWVAGIGGGAVLDTAKAVATMLTNEGDVLDYLEIIGPGGHTLAQKPLPFVLIPTTAGSGAEATRNSVIKSPERRLKVSLRSPLMVAHTVIVDPELHLDVPPRITAFTGMDALAQLIEAYTCQKASAFTDGLCLEGTRRITRSLLRAVQDGGNLQARADMATAALFGGLALANAGLGAVHGIAGPLGGMIEAPHGAICAALLPRVTSLNVSAMRQRDPENEALDRYKTIATILTGRSDAKAEDCATALQELSDELDMPTLGSLGFNPNETPELVAKAMRASSMRGNPIMLLRPELSTVIKSAV